MHLACLDLEGVLVPEVWINVARATGIDELKATTRDVPNYDVLMKQRLRILSENNLTLPDIQKVIAGMKPLPGAKDFLDWLKLHCQVVILSDTFYEFAAPLMAQLDYPTLFCHNLVTRKSGEITDYAIRLIDQKKKAVLAFQQLEFTVIAAGDSYNDTSMLAAADKGILFCPPQNVIDEFPQFPVTRNYKELTNEFLKVID